MKKTALAFCMLLWLLLGTFHFSGLSSANPSINPQIPFIQITSPPYPPSKFENNTVNLEIYVNMYNDSPKLTSVSYSLDEGPLVYLENLTVTNIIDFGQGKIDFTLYEASTVLEGLSEGNHTVVAYSGDLSVSRTFTVMYNQPSSTPSPEPTLTPYPTPDGNHRIPDNSGTVAAVIVVLMVIWGVGMLIPLKKSHRDKNP
jgi:hypothetical protein